MAKIAITTENTSSKLRSYANPRTLDYMLEQNKEFQDFFIGFFHLPWEDSWRIKSHFHTQFRKALEGREAFLRPPFKKSSRKAYNGHICRSY